jgi:hypothetical protein
MRGCGAAISEKGIFWVLPRFGAGPALAGGSKMMLLSHPPWDFRVYRVQHKKRKKNLPRIFSEALVENG